MPKYSIRFKTGSWPTDASQDGDIVVEAAVFKSSGGFIDFYSEATKNVGGTLNAKGRVVHRVSESVVAEIREIEA